MYKHQDTALHSNTAKKSTRMWKDSSPKEKQDIVVDRKGI